MIHEIRVPNYQKHNWRFTVEVVMEDNMVFEFPNVVSLDITHFLCVMPDFERMIVYKTFSVQLRAINLRGLAMRSFHYVTSRYDAQEHFLTLVR